MSVRVRKELRETTPGLKNGDPIKILPFKRKWWQLWKHTFRIEGSYVVTVVVNDSVQPIAEIIYVETVSLPTLQITKDAL